MKSNDIAVKYLHDHNVASMEELNKEQAKEIALMLCEHMQKENIYDKNVFDEFKASYAKKARAALDSLVNDATMMEMAMVGLHLTGTEEQQEQSSTILLNTMDTCNELQQTMLNLAFPLATAFAVIAKQKELRKLQEDISE